MNDIIVTPPKMSGPKVRKIGSWIQRLAFCLTIFTPLFFAVSALGSRFGLWDWKFGFGVLTRNVGMKLIFATLIAGLLAGLVCLLVKPRRGWWIAGLAVIIPGLALAKGASFKTSAQTLPLIHDITTDTQNPPDFTEIIIAARAATEGVNSLDYHDKVDLRENTLVSVLQARDYPDIRPLILTSPPEVIFGEALATAHAMGWDVVNQDTATGIIEATATTFWFGFKDDVIIRIQPSSDGGTVLDIRSVSRVGASDVGANASRIRAFTEKISSH